MIDRQISTLPRFRSVGFSFPRYSEKSFIKIYRALYGDTVCMHAALPRGTNMAAVKQQKHLSLSVSIETKNFYSRVLIN